jgi:hypothetical protein
VVASNRLSTYSSRAVLLALSGLLSVLGLAFQQLMLTFSTTTLFGSLTQVGGCEPVGFSADHLVSLCLGFVERKKPALVQKRREFRASYVGQSQVVLF